MVLVCFSFFFVFIFFWVRVLDKAKYSSPVHVKLCYRIVSYMTIRFPTGHFLLASLDSFSVRHRLTMHNTSIDVSSSHPFYRAMHFSAKRGIAIACRLSVRPSVCLSVRL